MRTPWASRLFLSAGLLLCASASAQTTNWWTGNGSYHWTNTTYWNPNTNYPNSVGAVAFITNNVSANRILTLNTSNTLGTLIWGDWDRGSQIDLRRATGGWLTFDTGDDGRMALISHATGDRANMDIGNGSDDTDVGITVTDAQGLYIDAFRSIFFGGRGSLDSIFDGGGHDIVKGEDDTVFFQRIVTNVNNIWVRDGSVRIDPEGNRAWAPNINTVIVGVASGVVDAGEANPLGTITNNAEGTVNDRRQFAMFELIGAAATNGIGAAMTNGAAVMTNDFNIVMNRGIFRSYNRLQTNGAPAVYSGNVQLNGDASEVFFQIESDSTSVSNIVLRHVFAGNMTGPGGFTKWNSGEMVLANSNDFTGAVNILRGNERVRGTVGGLRLEGQGTMSGVSAIHLERDGALFIDNSGVALSNRINDAGTITTWGRSQIEFVGNDSSDTYERLGITTVTNGRLAIEFDSDDASPRAHVLEFASLNRAKGTVLGFHASDIFQGAFATNGPGSITLNLLDGGASLLQVGALGSNATDRSVVVGVFGGDGVDWGIGFVDKTTMTPNRADEFMTVDGGRLRTLRPDEMVHLGGGTTNVLLISQASANPNDNVNINFASDFLNFSSYSITNALNQTITKRVVGDTTFNSIRLGLARGEPNVLVTNTMPLKTVTNLPTDFSRSLLIDDGIKLTSESGMLLMGRDITSTNGDSPPDGHIFVYGGTLDLDGASNNREAIIHNDGASNLYLRTTIEASQGLTKSGQGTVLLNSENKLGGTVSIAQANLYLLHGGALNGATDVRLGGDGLLILASGIAVTNDIPLTTSPMPYGNRIIYSEGGQNLWAGDIRINNVDREGLTLNDMRLGAGINSQNAGLTLLGDIGRVDPGTVSDIYMIDSPQVTTIESAGILNLMGTFGDYIDVNGNAVPFNPAGTGASRVAGGWLGDRAANENDVLRFRIDGPSPSLYYGDELAVHIYKPWNSAGRINAEQGTILFLGDPSLGQGDFWTTNALRVSDFGNGMSGFVLGGSGTDAGGSVTFMLTKDGQSFNPERWTVAQDNSANNTITMGLQLFGPSNATVTIGNEFYDIDPSAADDQITISGASGTTVRDFRLFSHNGYDSATGSNSVGTVNVIQSIRGNDYSMLSKVGNGVVTLQATTNTAIDQSNDIRGFLLLGGELVLDRASAGLDGSLRRSSDSGASLYLAGGDLTYLGASGLANYDELMNKTLTVRPGDSEVAVLAGTGRTTNTLFLATNGTATVSRLRGGTVNFVEDQGINPTGTNVANIRLGGMAGNSRVGSWATYGTNLHAGAYTWAATDALSNVVEFTAFSTDTYGAGLHTDVTTATNLSVASSAASLRFSSGVDLGLGGTGFNVSDGGILITPGVNTVARITNGTLTSSGKELIIQNYADPAGSLGIAAGITGNVSLTFSGTGKTVLSGNNTFNGPTYLNGGTVQIDSASRLGNTVSNLEMRGGTLFSTASMFLSNRTILLGGDGGTFNVASGTTNTLGRIQSESNYLAATRLNNGLGDLIKTGQGTLGLTYSIYDERTQLTNTYQGLTDIREGTLRIQATNAFALGSSKSFYDGTIVRSGATLAMGSNTANIAYNLREWLMLEEGSTLRIERQSTSYSSPGVDGIIHFLGDATVWVEAYEADLNESAGYLMGPGSLIKDGDAPLRIFQYNPEFTGGIVIKDSYLEDYGYAATTIPNASSITIGINDNVNRGAVGFMVRGVERNGAASIWDVAQDIFVQGNSSDTRLGVRRADHGDIVNFNGDIDLSNLYTNRELQLYYERDVTQRNPNGGDAFREETYINLTGDIRGGDRRIRTLIEQNGGLSMDPFEGSQALTNEPDYMVFWTLSGSNVDWTGSLEIGNRSGTSIVNAGPDRDKQHFVRFGKNDGAETLAIGSNNWVVMRNDATLQTYGSQVTVGSLFSDGSEGGALGYFGNQPVSNTFIENGGTNASTLRVFQTANSAFDGVIRDGTYYAPNATNMSAAMLSIVKAGPGTLALGGSNYYSGGTMVEGGALRLDHDYALPGGIGAVGGTSLLTLSNGVLGLGVGDFYRNLGSAASNVTFAAGGGFAAYGEDRYIHFGGQTQTLAWGQANFVSGDNELMFGAVDSTHTIIFDNPLDLNGGDRRLFAVQGGSNSGGRVISSIFGSGGIIKTGSGTLEFSGSNSYTGDTVVAGGSLRINNDSALPGGMGPNGTSLLALTNGGVLGLGFNDFNRDLGTGGSNVTWAGSGGFAAYGADRHVNIGGQTQTLTWGQANFVAGDNELVFGASDATHTLIFDNHILLDGTNRFRANDGLVYIDGRITGDIGDAPSSVGTFWKTGDGILELTGSNTFSGGFSIFGGQLLFSGANAMPSAGAINISNFATIGLGVGDFTRALGTNDNEVYWTGSGGFYASGADRVVNLGGATGQVTWGTGFFVPEAVDGSVLVLGAGSATHTLDFQNPIALGASNRTVLVHNGTAAIDGRLSGEISGAGGLVKTGDGVLGLSSGNTYTGITLVSAGLISMTDESALGSNPASFASNHLTLAGGGIQATESFSIDDPNRGITLGIGGGAFDVAAAKILSNLNVIAGPGSLTKSGDGTLVMPVANLYTGSTILVGGILSITNENALGPNPTASNNRQLVFDGGTLQAAAGVTIDDGNRNITVEDGGGTIDVVSGAVFTNARSINTLTNVMGALNKTGAGAFESRGNTYLSDFNVSDGQLRLGAGTVWVSNAMTVNGGSALNIATTTYINRLSVSNANLLFEGGDTYIRDFRPDFASMPTNGLVFGVNGYYKYLFQDLSGTNADVTFNVPSIINQPAVDAPSIVFGRSAGTNKLTVNIDDYVLGTNRVSARIGGMSGPDGTEFATVNVNAPISYTNAGTPNTRYLEGRSIYGGVVNINSNIIVNQALDVAGTFIFQGNGEIRMNSDLLDANGAFTNYVRLDGSRNLKVTVDSATRFGNARQVQMYDGAVLKFNYDVSNDPLGYPGAGLFTLSQRGWYFEFGVTQSNFFDPFISAPTGLIARAWTGLGGNLSNAVYTGGALAGQNIYVQTNLAIMQGTLNAPTLADVGSNTLYLGLLSPTNGFDLNTLDPVYKGVALGAMTLVGSGRNYADYPATDEGYSGTLNARTGQDLEVGIFGEVFVEPVTTNLGVSDLRAHFNSDTGVGNFRGPGNLILQSGNNISAFGGTVTNLNRIGVSLADGFGFDSHGSTILDLANDMAVSSNLILSVRNGMVRVRANGALGTVTGSSNTTLVIGSGGSFWADNANNSDNANFSYNRGKIIFEDDGAFYSGRYNDRFDASTAVLNNMVFGSNSLLVLNDAASGDSASYRIPGVRRMDTTGYTYLTTNMNVVLGGGSMRTALVANSAYAFALADGHRLTHSATGDANFDRIFRTNSGAAVEVDIRAEAGASNVMLVGNSGRNMYLRPQVVTTNALWTTFGSTNRFITVTQDGLTRTNALGTGSVHLYGATNLFQDVNVAGGTLNIAGLYSRADAVLVAANATLSNVASSAVFGDVMSSGTATFAGSNVSLANIEAAGITNISATVRLFADNLTVTNVRSTGGGDVIFGAAATDNTHVLGDVTMGDVLHDNPTITLAAGNVRIDGNIYLENTTTTNAGKTFTPTLNLQADTNLILGSVYIGPTNGSLAGGSYLRIGNANSDLTIIGGDLVLNQAGATDYGTIMDRGDVVVSNNIIINALGIDPKTVTNNPYARMPSAAGAYMFVNVANDTNTADGIGFYDRLRDNTLALGPDGILIDSYGGLRVDYSRTNLFADGYLVGQKITIDSDGPKYGYSTGTDHFTLWVRAVTNVINGGYGAGTPLVNFTNVWMRDGSYLRINEENTDVRVGLVLDGTNNSARAFLSESSGSDNIFDLLDVRSGTPGQTRTLQIGTTNVPFGGSAEAPMESTLFGQASEDVIFNVFNGRLRMTNGAEILGTATVSRNGSLFDILPRTTGYVNQVLVQAGSFTNRGDLMAFSNINVTGGSAYFGGLQSYATNLSLSGGTGIVASAGLGIGKLYMDGGLLRAMSNYTLNAGSGTTLGGNGGRFSVDTNMILTANSAIDGIGGLTKLGPGTMTLAGSSANTYTGLTTVGQGTLALNKTPGVNAIVGDGASSKVSPDVVIGGGGTLLWLSSNQVDDSAMIMINTGGIMNLNGKKETLYEFVNNGGTYLSGRGGGLTVVDPTWTGGTNAILGNDVYGNLDISGGLNLVRGDEGTGLGAGSITVGSGGLNFFGTGNPSLILSADHTNAGSLILSGDVTFAGASGTASILSGPALLDTGGAEPVLHPAQSNTVAGFIDLNGATRNFIISNGSGAVDMNVSASIVGGSGSGINKSGLGTLLLSGTNSYLGPTTVSGGTLLINADNSLANGLVTVAAGGALGGDGIVGGATIFEAGATHLPGFLGAGIETFANGVTYSNASVFQWQLLANTDAGRGTAFDGVNITSNQLNVVDGALMALVFSGDGSTVDWSNAFWTTNHQWLVFDLVGEAASNSLTSSQFTFASTNWLDMNSVDLASVMPYAGFTLEYGVAGELYLNYLSYVPEPSTWVLLLAGFALIGYFARRRRS